MMGESMKGYICNVMICIVASLLCGCTVIKIEEEEIQSLDYAIVREEAQPEEVQILIEENQDGKMKMSYIDQGVEYIIIGYGAQETSGYSVEILSVYETENAVYVSTNLLGPMSGEAVIESITYPFVVIAIEENEKPIIYE